MKKTLFIVIILAISATACLKNLICINGNGMVESQRRDTKPFHQLQNSTFADVIYKKADTLSIIVRAETNILPHLVTEISNGILEIRTDPGGACFTSTEQPVITVTAPDLDNLIISGSGNFIADSLSGSSVTIRLTGSGDVSAGVISSDDLSVTLTGSGDIDIVKASAQNTDLRISGSGDISIRGSSDNANMRITGSGDINAFDFLILTAVEIISGSGNIHSRVESTLNATISGSGNIYLKGNPAITQEISGSGRIIRQ